MHASGRWPCTTTWSTSRSRRRTPGRSSPSYGTAARAAAIPAASASRSQNLLGFGSELGLSYRSDIDRDSTTLRYRDPHLLGSRWRLDAQYADNSDGELQRLESNGRSMRSIPAARPGCVLRSESRIDPVYDNGNVVASFGIDERFGERVRRLVGGAARRRCHALERRHHARRAACRQVDPAAPGPLPADYKLVYPWLGIEWIEDEFQATRNLDQIGRTEDLALGWRARLQLGLATPAFGSDRRATVFDAAVSKGWMRAPQHTLLFTATTSGRVESGTPVNALLGVTRAPTGGSRRGAPCSSAFRPIAAGTSTSTSS